MRERFGSIGVLFTPGRDLPGGDDILMTTELVADPGHHRGETAVVVRRGKGECVAWGGRRIRQGNVSLGGFDASSQGERSGCGFREARSRKFRFENHFT